MYEIEIGIDTIEVENRFGPSVTYQIATYPDPPHASKFYEAYAARSPTCIVYFVRRDGRIVYVGASKRSIQQRKKNHEIIKDSDELAWICFKQSDVWFAEAYYIGLLRPHLNFRKK